MDNITNTATVFVSHQMSQIPQELWDKIGMQPSQATKMMKSVRYIQSLKMSNQEILDVLNDIKKQVDEIVERLIYNEPIQVHKKKVNQLSQQQREELYDIFGNDNVLYVIYRNYMNMVGYEEEYGFGFLSDIDNALSFEKMRTNLGTEKVVNIMNKCLHKAKEQVKQQPELKGMKFSCEVNEKYITWFEQQ